MPAPVDLLVSNFELRICLPVLLGFSSFTACAHVAAPSGGPPDSIPPRVIAVTPDSRSVVPDFEGEVRFDFSETISERGIDRAVTLYPLEPRPDVDKGGQDLKVRPRRGWRADRIYHIVIEPIVQDLFDNAMTERLRYVLSTGPPVPENRVRGRIFDRITGRPLPEGRVDLVQMPDTLRYGAAADTAGRFEMEAMPSGVYLAIGYEDRNQNRRADPLDRADTARVELEAEDSIELAFRVFKHDTVPPRLARARSIDSVTVELEFDLYLDPEVPVAAANVEIADSATGAPIALDTVLHGWAYEEWMERRRAAVEAEAGDTAAADTGAADTATAAPDTLPLPARRLLAIARSAIHPSTYLVEAREVRGLSGLPGGGEAVYTQPEPPPPDTAEAAEDEAPPDSLNGLRRDPPDGRPGDSSDPWPDRPPRRPGPPRGRSR